MPRSKSDNGCRMFCRCIDITLSHIHHANYCDVLCIIKQSIAIDCGRRTAWFLHYMINIPNRYHMRHLCIAYHGISYSLLCCSGYCVISDRGITKLDHFYNLIHTKVIFSIQMLKAISTWNSRACWSDLIDRYTHLKCLSWYKVCDILQHY